MNGDGGKLVSIDAISQWAGPQLVLRRGTDAEPVPLDWLWNDWLAGGKLHLIGGAPGTGKTTIAMTFAAIVSSGGCWPDGTRASPGTVVIWSGEDDINDTLAPRLIAAGAEMDRVRFIDVVADRGKRYPFDPARDLELLRDQLRCMPDVRLIVIDPLVSAVTGDSHKNSEVRRSLQPLVDLANEFGCAILGITHFAKATMGRDPIERVAGSIAFAALARVVMVTAKHRSAEGEPGRRVLVRAKSNIGPDGGGFAYTFQHDVAVSVCGITASRVVWGPAVAGDARSLLDLAERDADAAGPASFLHGLLADGPRLATDIFRDGKAAGFSKAAIYRAKAKLNVQDHKAEFRGKSTWKLPSESTSIAVVEGGKDANDCASTEPQSLQPLADPAPLIA